MLIFLFDMDGVLLEPNGYHLALQETVRRVSLSLGFSGVQLTRQQIARFEALAITSEWQSSALCMAVMVMEKLRQGQTYQISDLFQPPLQDMPSFELELDHLFAALEAQPVTHPALERGAAAIEVLAQHAGVPAQLPVSLVLDCEKIEVSPTLNIFQELVLGSETFQQIYNKPPQMEQTSYLILYDKPLLSAPHRQKLISWLEDPQHGAAIMTNRPSNTLLGFPATPEAENGAALVGLHDLPMVGFGELDWLAAKIQQPVGELIKPNPQHALAAALAAGGRAVAESLTLAGGNGKSPAFEALHGSTIVIFEDSPGGFIAGEQAAAVLESWGISVELQKIGVSEDENKRSALASKGASVVSSVNDGLESILGLI